MTKTVDGGRRGFLTGSLLAGAASVAAPAVVAAPARQATPQAAAIPTAAHGQNVPWLCEGIGPGDHLLVHSNVGLQHASMAIYDPHQLRPALARALAVAKAGKPALVDVVSQPR